MIEEKIRELGLSDKEVRIYLTVIELGKASPSRISNATGINRSTVYAVANELIKQGLLEEDHGGTTTYYLPASSQTLKRLIQREKQTLEQKEALLKDVAQEIEQFPRSKTHIVPRIQFIEHEENIIEFLYKQTPIWHQSLVNTKSNWWGFQDHTFVEHESYRKWIKWSWEVAPPQVVLKLLSNDSAIEKKMERENIAQRQIKFWKGAVGFTATQWIGGDYSVMHMTKQKPHYLVQLYDPVYTQNMRVLFENLWNIT